MKITQKTGLLKHVLCICHKFMFIVKHNVLRTYQWQQPFHRIHNTLWHLIKAAAGDYNFNYILYINLYRRGDSNERGISQDAFQGPQEQVCSLEGLYVSYKNICAFFPWETGGAAWLIPGFLNVTHVIMNGPYHMAPVKADYRWDAPNATAAIFIGQRLQDLDGAEAPILRAGDRALKNKKIRLFAKKMAGDCCL